MSDLKNENKKSWASLFFDPKIRYMNSKKNKNGLVNYVLILTTLISLITTIGIIVILLTDSFHFFEQVPILDFLTGKRKYRRRKVSHQTKNRIESDWRQIEVLLDGGKPSQLRQALITADKTVDGVLRDLVPGETMGERLKNAKDLFSDYSVYDKLWKAHKVRNSLVHEPGYEPPHHMIRGKIEDLRTGLKKLGVKV